LTDIEGRYMLALLLSMVPVRWLARGGLLWRAAWQGVSWFGLTLYLAVFALGNWVAQAGRGARMPVSGLSWMIQRAAQVAQSRMRTHWLPLAIVLAACGVGQVAVLFRQPLVYLWPDSTTYLAIAKHMLTTHLLNDPVRTPGYPLFLALLWLLTGGQHLWAVVLAQAVLIVCAAVEVYVLLWRVRGQRLLACLIACVLGINPFVSNWERLMLTEALTYWIIVTLFLVFERLLRQVRAAPLVAFVSLSVAAILTRPQYIYLPAMLLIVLALRRRSAGRRAYTWRPLTLALAVTYGLVLAYMAGNAALYGYFGLSDIANINLFGKVIEYRMDTMSGTVLADPRLAHFQADVERYISAHRDEPLVRQVFGFRDTHPAYNADNWAIYSAYSDALIERHPLYFIERTSADVLACGYAEPLLYGVEPDASPAWVGALDVGFSFAARIYAFLPLLLLVYAVRAWRRLGQVADVLFFTLLLAAAGNILISALTDFVDFPRLRFPVDWAMIVVFIVGLVDAVRALARATAVMRGRMQLAIGKEQP
jgi:hypothetical protein